MISKPIFILLFEVILVRAFDLINFDHIESTICTTVLIREFGPQVNLRLVDVHTIAMCPNGYNVNSTIRSKCETTTLKNTTILEDIFLFTLALDYANKSKLYYNVYCAICNGEKDFYQFPPYLQYQLYDGTNSNISHSKAVEKDEKYYPVSDHTSLLSGLKSNEKNELVSFNKTGFIYKFNPYRVLIVPRRSKKVFREPMESHEARPRPICLPSPYDDFECTNNTKIENCYYNDTNYSNIFNLQKVIGKLNKERGRTSNASFCPKEYIDAGKENSICKYKGENGYFCWWNRFLKKGVDYAEGENGEIFFVHEAVMMNMTRDEYTVETGFEDLIYLCGLDQFMGLENQYCKDKEIVNTMQCLLRRFSMICIVVYLTLNSRREILSRLVYKITYSYYATLLMMYVREEISVLMLNRSCFLNYTAYRYLLQSSIFWIITATWYLWIIIRSPGAERTMNQNIFKSRMIYLSMCAIGWVLPAVVALLFYVFEPDPPCPKVQGYLHLKLCKPSDELDAYYWFIFGTICIISAIVSAQFSVACYYYEFAKIMPSENEVSRADWAARMVFFFKIAYSIVLYLLLLIASAFFREGSIYEILLHLWSFHGTLIFFMYSFKRTVLKKWLVKRGSIVDTMAVNT